MIRPAPRRQAPTGHNTKGDLGHRQEIELAFFVPGRLTNPLNSRRGWRAVWSSSRDWRRRTADAALVAMVKASSVGSLKQVIAIHEPQTPRQITFRAHVWRLFDDEGLVAACKPVRDGLCPPTLSWRRGRMVAAAGAELIHSDAPDSGHEFRYEQVVDRAGQGVEIRVESVQDVRDALGR
jgi:hypothetical protein